MEVTRRDMESFLGRFWRYENATIQLIPVDEKQPRLGGKVQVKSLAFNFQTFTPEMTTQYGIYSDDFVTFGTFTKGVNPLDNEELLLQIVQDNHNDNIIDKVTFKFENNSLTFQKQVNEEKTDAEINHAIEQT